MIFSKKPGVVTGTVVRTSNHPALKPSLLYSRPLKLIGSRYPALLPRNFRCICQKTNMEGSRGRYLPLRGRATVVVSGPVLQLIATKWFTIQKEKRTGSDSEQPGSRRGALATSLKRCRRVRGAYCITCFSDLSWLSQPFPFALPGIIYVFLKMSTGYRAH